MARIAVMISGYGSNLQALIDAGARGDLGGGGVSVVFSNRADAYGLERAERHGIPAEVLVLADWKARALGREEYDQALAERVALYQPDLVVLAGWMHVLSTTFLDRFPGRVINLHPALPGAFPGTRAIVRALEAAQQGKIDRTGVMVHEVVPEVDAGPVLACREVPILADDRLETLEARIHDIEHELLIEAVRAKIAGEGGREG